MAMKTETKRVVFGLLSGTLIMAALSAFDWWIFTYTDPGSGFLGPNSAWAPAAAIVGGAIGILAGALLGLLLGLRPRGSLFGLLAGALDGLAVVVLLLFRSGMSTGETRIDLMFAAFVPIGAISGFLTSLIVSAITSQAEPRNRSHGVLDLQQNKTDESR
jgi:hypothetical protein